MPIVIVPPEVDSSWELHSPLICGVGEEHSSDAAIRYAGALATRLDARLTLLNARTLSVTRVPDTATTVGYFIYEMAEVEEKASRELLRDRRRLAGPAAHVKLAFVEGRAARRLREAANQVARGPVDSGLASPRRAALIRRRQRVGGPRGSQPGPRDDRSARELKRARGGLSPPRQDGATMKH